jgi:hypothetical protein
VSPRNYLLALSLGCAAEYAGKQLEPEGILEALGSHWAP